MSLTTVSVLMTAYNREKYIAEAIESVLASTFRDFELIIVDDNSEDRTLEIAKRYISDPRVQLHVNEKNLGDYPNRNRAAELARGKYLKYVDSDDIIYPHGLEVMVQSMECFPEAALGLCRPPVTRGPYPMLLIPLEAYREHFFESDIFVNAPLSAIIRAEPFRVVGGFSGRRQIGDAELWLKLAARYPIVKMGRDLTWWRTHGQQEVAYDSEADKTQMGFSVSMAALNSPNCPLPAEERNRAIHWVKWRCSRTLLRMTITRMQPHLAYGLFRECDLTLLDLVNGIFGKNQRG